MPKPAVEKSEGCYHSPTSEFQKNQEACRVRLLEGICSKIGTNT